METFDISRRDFALFSLPHLSKAHGGGRTERQIAWREQPEAARSSLKAARGASRFDFDAYVHLEISLVRSLSTQRPTEPCTDTGWAQIAAWRKVVRAGTDLL